MQAVATEKIWIREGYAFKRLTASSRFHTLNGLTFGPDGRLYIASVLGETVSALDVHTGLIETIVEPPLGHSDDIAFSPEGDLLWTTMAHGVVRRRKANGDIDEIASDLPGTNSIAFTRDGRRLFVGQVFLAEGLWEIDPAGRNKPRLVIQKTGGLNAFQFGPDGKLYAPSWERGQVVRIDPDSGETEILIEGLQKPGAVHFDSKDRLYVLDDATGELFALEPRGSGWQKRIIARLPTGTDNFAIGKEDRLFISNMVDNSIHAVDPDSGEVIKLLSGELAFPCGIAVSEESEGQVIHVADGCSYRQVNQTSSQISDIARAVATPLKLPTSVSLGSSRVVFACEAFGAVQRYNHAGNLEDEFMGFEQPSSAIELADGSILVAEPNQGRVLRVVGQTRSTVIEGLRFPNALEKAGSNAFYVSEGPVGRLLRVSLEDSSTQVVAEELGAIRSFVKTPDGGFYVLEVEQQILIRIALDGSREVIARNLPVGHLVKPYPRSGGIALGGHGELYLAADRENALYRIEALRP